MEDVFRAIADPTRRELLDALFHQDGQTLAQLESQFESMSRQNVMKHLRVLEEAHLVVTRRRGREKLHFLNPVPIRLMHDRWVSKYSEPWVARTQRPQERPGENNGKGLRDLHPHHARTRCGKQSRIPRFDAKYNFGAGQHCDWKAGSKYTMGAGDISSARARFSRSIRPPSLCRPCARCGATT